MMTRRSWLAGSLAAGGLSFAGGARAASERAEASRIALWPGEAPGGDNVSVADREVLRSPNSPAGDTAWVNVRHPFLSRVRPARRNGAAILLIPGGGYQRVAVGLGGRRLADLFASAGFVVFTLVYRLPSDGWSAGPNAPLQDAQRALRIIRSRAMADSFDPARIGVLGGSAGGHLAARLSCRQDIASYNAIDAIDDLPLAPRCTGLLFPVVAMSGPSAHRGSRRKLLGPGTDDGSADLIAADAKIAPATPPTFLAHAMDDDIVPWTNSVLMMQALKQAGVPQEAHFFESGGHGFGVEGPASNWSAMFLEFAGRHGLTGKDAPRPRA